MLFNTLEYLLFLPIVFILYWGLGRKDLRYQNLILIASSYFFYACWDWRFMFLLIFSTLLDFFSGIKIYEAENKREKRMWLWLSIIINLGFLGVFKYYNFFITSLTDGLSLIGIQENFVLLNIILPVGISFYTFHGLSYIIDIYYDRIKPERNFVNYSVFVSFFPLLVAGPIERATHLLPQILKKRAFNYSMASDGLKQILWGLFKKIVIADNCAEFANTIFNNHANYSGSVLALGAIFFTFQIYCDFSGYSDIAIGSAKLLGINLIRNFAYPYFSRDIAEFWRRWHISLSSWFKDYVYIPLGGNKGGIWKNIRNILIIFLISGFWHGSNWTFICWGLLNAIYILPSVIFKTNRVNLEIVAAGRKIPTFRELMSILQTFSLTAFAWIFFRAENLKHAFDYISGLFSISLFSIPYYSGIDKTHSTLIMIIFLIIIEWIGREQQFAIEDLGKTWKRIYRYVFYYILILFILYFGGKEQEFIYFQF
jgi:D-alanyl-lipoteichoic acid acyltransferase DltB (MBOAT superfamily)